MADFVLQDLKNQTLDDREIRLSGALDEYLILKQDDVIILKDTVFNRDGVLFLTNHNEKIHFLDQSIDFNGILKYLKIDDKSSVSDKISSNTTNDKEDLLRSSVFDVNVLGSIKNNEIYTKDFNQKAAVSSKYIGDVFEKNYVYKKTIYVDDICEKIYFLKDILKDVQKVDIKISLSNYEQSKDSIGFDGEMGFSFDYSYSVQDERLNASICIEQAANSILDKFYYQHICTNDFDEKIINICINNVILYEMRLVKLDK